MTGATLSGALVCGAAGWLAYGARGKSSSFFGPSVFRGVRNRRAIALTFDDGPSAATSELLDLLAQYRAPATFFQCGQHVRGNPGIAQAVHAAGHEIGNHTDTHPLLCTLGSAHIEREIARTQEAIAQATGRQPSLFRAPYGVRWFGLRRAQQHHHLLGVMWTAIALDWRLTAPQICQRLLRAARNGAIFCLHDGREMQVNPDIRPTLEAVRRLLPELLSRGFHFETVSQLLCTTI